LQRSTDASLKRLKTDYVDLLLVHWPNPAIPLGETLGAIAQVKAEGKARHIGVSNFTVALLGAAVADHGADLLANQVEYHPFLSQKPVLACLNLHGMMLTAYRPVAKGETNQDSVLAGIGKKYGKSGAQVALRWLIEQDRVAAIPKAASREHCQANFDIFDFSLDAADAAAIAALTGNRRYLDPAWAPEWDPPE
jgi:2,5-diketo-D-gluconate reductase B